MRVAIIGCGMLGYDLVKVFSEEKSNELYCFDISEKDNFLGYKVSYLDVTNFENTYKTITRINPDVIIHNAAITDVDKCEDEPQVAYKVNVIGTKNVAIAAQKYDSLLVFVSTDYVFDGEKKEEYTEFDEPSPINIYGKTKLEAEKIVRELCGRFLITRTAWLFGRNRENFVSYWYKNILEDKSIKVVKSQCGSPTYSKNLAERIKFLVYNNKLGLYHLTNKGHATRVEVVKEICSFLRKKFDEKKVEILEPEEVFRGAKRPKNIVLRNFVWELENLPEVVSWQNALKDYLKEISTK